LDLILVLKLCNYHLLGPQRCHPKSATVAKPIGSLYKVQSLPNKFQCSVRFPLSDFSSPTGSSAYEMPNNTWFTPYKFPAWSCLSFGPSQGMSINSPKRPLSRYLLNTQSAKRRPPMKHASNSPCPSGVYLFSRKRVYSMTCAPKSPIPTLHKDCQVPNFLASFSNGSNR